jgi:hypothetical protein
MSPLRIAFLLVFIVAAVAFFIARSAVASFSTGPQLADAPPDTPEKTAVATATMTPKPRPTRAAPSPTVLPPTATPQPTAYPSATTIPAPTTVPSRVPRPTAAPKERPTQRAVRHVSHVTTARHPHRVIHRPRPHPTAKPRPTATALSGVTTLTNYWISQTAAPRGTTIAVGYTIDNGTGTTERVMLGASIKPTSVRTWGRSISDPFHDVVAVVPPGVTTHVRYFTLSSGLRPGAYDVAWGLRNAATGTPVALVSAPVSLRVTR